MLCTPFLFTEEDFMKYLNISNSEEMDHLLKCLSDNLIQDENMLSEHDIKNLCSEIDFEEEIPENISSTPLTALPLSDITLGDELNLSNILENESFLAPLQNIVLDNNDFLQVSSDDTLHTPTFTLDEFLEEPNFNTQEVSTAVREIEKVRVQVVNLFCLQMI